MVSNSDVPAPFCEPNMSQSFASQPHVDPMSTIDESKQANSDETHRTPITIDGTSPFDEINRNTIELELSTQLEEIDAAIEAEKAALAIEKMSTSIATKRAELTAIRQARSSMTAQRQDHTIATPPPATRASFSTPFTDGRPDWYLAGVRKPHRQTLSFADHINSESISQPLASSTRGAVSPPVSSNSVEDSDDEHSDDRRLAPSSQPRVAPIAVPMPKVFNGDEADLAKLRTELMEFIDHLERYVSYAYASKRISPSPYEWMCTATMFLAGPAANVYRDLLVIAGEEAALGKPMADVTWEQLRQALIDQFGRPMDGYELIAFMFALKQRSNESVREFSDRFHLHHMELIRQELASRDLSTALYLNALVPDIRDHLKEQLAANSFFLVNKIERREPRSAIASLQRLAVAREATLRSKQHSNNNSSTSVASTQPAAASSSGARTTNQAAAPKTNEKLEPIPDALFQARRAAGLCGRCNSSSHKTFLCNKPRNLQPVPVTRAPSDAPRARMRTMNAAAATDAEPSSPKNQ
jgi:hypothetical protein